MKTKKILYRLKGEKSEFSQGFIIEEKGPGILINEKNITVIQNGLKKRT